MRRHKRQQYELVTEELGGHCWLKIIREPTVVWRKVSAASFSLFSIFINT